ncbi:MAG: hypothetical protein WD448_06525 [Woeseia sp.]
MADGSAVAARFEHEMDVVGHQTIGVDLDAEIDLERLQGIQVVDVIVVLGEDAAPIVSALSERVRGVRHE